MRKSFFAFCVLSTAMAFVQRANADVVINAVESGGNVVLTLSGNLDLNATQGFISNSAGYNGYLPSLGAISFTNANSDYYGLNFSTWTPYGPGTSFGNWDTSSGDAWHMFTNPVIGVPVGYVSGSALSSTATKFGATFASLGFAPGSYVSTLTNGNFVQTVTVNIGGAAVPEPTSFGLLSLFGAAAVSRRRKR